MKVNKCNIFRSCWWFQARCENSHFHMRCSPSVHYQSCPPSDCWWFWFSLICWHWLPYKWLWYNSNNYYCYFSASDTDNEFMTV